MYSVFELAFSSVRSVVEVRLLQELENYSGFKETKKIDLWLYKCSVLFILFEEELFIVQVTCTDCATALKRMDKKNRQT